MKRILSSRRDHYLAKFSIFLITVALIAGMVGCGNEFRCYLTIAITEGGTVVRPSEGTFSYYEGAPVKLMAQAEKGYKFVEWTGDVDTIDDVNEPTTTITMNGDYSITANFALEIIEIYDWDDLHLVWEKENLGSNCFLMNDLDSTTAGYNETASDTANGGDGWQPIGNAGSPFTGSFDGQGYEIRDMFITPPYKSYVGLFGYVGKGGVVNNVTVVNATVTGKDSDSVGGLVGWNGGTVSNSYTTGSVASKNDVGGLVGRNEGTVSYSYSTGSVTGKNDVGGLVGRNEGTVSNSYSTSSVTGEDDVGGLVGYNYEESTVSNSYTNGSVTGENCVGGLVGKNYNESTVSDSYSTGNVIGDVGVGGLIGFNDKSKVSNSHYNYDDVLVNGENIITIGALFGNDFDQWLANDKLLDLNGRLSQDNDYYFVNNVNDFKELLAFGQNSSLEFRLTNDLDLATEPNFYIPYFAGQFGGNGHKISNLSLNLTFASNIGLFGYLAGDREITAVGVDNVKITGGSFVGGLVGANWEGTVSNSYSTGSVTGKDYVGGLVGYNHGESTVKDSYSASNVFGDKYVGGLVGYNKYTVSNSTSTGSVTGHTSVGGLVGSNGGPVSESYSTGNITGHTSVGGLVGFNEGDYVKFSSSNCTVEGNYDVGGLVGYNEGGTISNSYSTGNVTGKDRVGGLVGQNKYIDIIKAGKVNSSYSTVSVSGEKEDVGGLVGQNIDGSVTKSFWDIETSGQAASDGGTPMSTTEMKSITTFKSALWQIRSVNLPSERNRDYTWNIVNGVTYPFLSCQP